MSQPEEEPTLTVAELITLLQRQPQDAKLWSEGCDCWGNVVKVKLCADGTVGLLRD